MRLTAVVRLAIRLNHLLKPFLTAQTKTSTRLLIIIDTNESYGIDLTFVLASLPRQV